MFTFYSFIYLLHTYCKLRVGRIQSRQIYLPQSTRQETFWMPVGFESTEKSATLSNAPQIHVRKQNLKLFKKKDNGRRLRNIQYTYPSICF